MYMPLLQRRVYKGQNTNCKRQRRQNLRNSCGYILQGMENKICRNHIRNHLTITTFTSGFFIDLNKSRNCLTIEFHVVRPRKKAKKGNVMKRDFLEGLGLEKETIDKILDENSKDIGKAKKDGEAATKELEEVKQTLADTNKELEEIKKSAGDNAELQKKIEELQEANNQKDIEMARAKRESIDELLLTEAKAKNLKAAKALLEPLEEADEEKYRTARAEQIKALVDSEESKFLFGSKMKGTEPGDPKGEPEGKPDFSKMTYSQIAEYMAENPGTELK